MRGFEQVDLKFKHHKHNTALPIRKTKFSAGYDFLSPMKIKLKPKEKKLIWTDLKVYMEPDECLIVQVRSSLGVKYDVVLANGLGIIDADYYNNPGNGGNIGITLKNNGKDQVDILKGEGIAQGIFLKYLVSDNCNSEEAREGGFGSTDG